MSNPFAMKSKKIRSLNRAGKTQTISAISLPHHHDPRGRPKRIDGSREYPAKIERANRALCQQNLCAREQNREHRAPGHALKKGLLIDEFRFALILEEEEVLQRSSTNSPPLTPKREFKEGVISWVVVTMDSEFCIHGVWRCSRAQSPKAYGP